MDASALIMDDAKTENVREMVDYTLEHGVYSRGHADRTHAVPASTCMPRSAFSRDGWKLTERKPGVCIPWEVKKKDFPPITGDEAKIRETWEAIDELGYNFLWTNLIW